MLLQDAQNVLHLDLPERARSGRRTCRGCRQAQRGRLSRQRAQVVRQMLRRDPLGARENVSVLHDVRHFANVARPGMLQQHINGLRG